MESRLMRTKIMMIDLAIKIEIAAESIFRVEFLINFNIKVATNFKVEPAINFEVEDAIDFKIEFAIDLLIVKSL